MAKKSIAKNYMYNLVYQILLMILPLITTPYISRVIGAEGIGIYSYTISITTYFILFGTLGISMYAQREIAYVQNDIKKRSKVFWEIIIFRAITVSISMIIFYFVFVLQGEYAIYYKVLMIEIFATCFDISLLFQGLEEFKKILFRNIIVKLISIICIFTFIKGPQDIIKYFVIYVISTFVGNLSLWFYLPKYIEKVKFRELEIFRHIKPTFVLFIPQIATQIYTVLDKTMIGTIIVDKSEVGYYEQAQKIVKLILTIITSLGTVMLPRIANKFANGKKEEIKDNILNSLNFVYFLSIPMIVGIIIVADLFIPMFLGEGYEKSTLIVCVISPIILMIGLSNVVGVQYLLPTKKQKEYTISVIGGAIVNFLLNIILIQKFMSIGAAIATVIAETVVTVIQLYAVRKEFNIKNIFKLSRNYLLASFIMLIIISILKKLLINCSLNIIVITFIIAIVGILIYIVVLLILKDRYLKNIINNLSKRIKQK